METASILICEDERLVAKDLELVLTRNGYHVVGIAGSGAQALALAREKVPDLALMDIQLEGPMNGLTVAALLSEELSIPSIFLTAYADEATVEEAKLAQPLSYLIKPFGESELRVAIETGLARHREQTRVVRALREHVSELTNTDAIEEAVNLERQFLNAERTSAMLRVAGTIGGKVEEGLSQIQMHLDELTAVEGLDAKIRSRLQGALIHQDRTMQVAEDLRKCLEAGDLSFEELPIEGLVCEAIEEALPLLRTGVSIVQQLPDAPISVSADRGALKEALLRILLNANQSIDRKGVVTTTISSLFEAFPERMNPEAQPGWYTEVRIEDTGKGILKDHLDRIFEPCFTASGAPMNTGLGLSVVYRVMQQHLGWVTIASEPERGTAVSLFLPVV